MDHCGFRKFPWQGPYCLCSSESFLPCAFIAAQTEGSPFRLPHREAKSCSTNHDVLHQAGIWRGAKRYLGNMAWTQQDSEEIQEGVETTEGRARAWKLESEVLALRPNFFPQLWNPGHITQLSELSPSHTHLSELAHWVG